MDERNNHFDFDFTPIGQAIKKAREARGMTREELSGIIGYAPRHIQSIENEGQYPSNSFNRAFDRISGLYISHRKPPFPEDLRSSQSAFFATTTSLPFWAEYSQVDRVMSLSPYSAVTPVS